jgi:hypothetical protein
MYVIVGKREQQRELVCLNYNIFMGEISWEGPMSMNIHFKSARQECITRPIRGG